MVCVKAWGYAIQRKGNQSPLACQNAWANSKSFLGSCITYFRAGCEPIIVVNIMVPYSSALGEIKKLGYKFKYFIQYIGSSSYKTPSNLCWISEHWQKLYNKQIVTGCQNVYA